MSESDSGNGWLAAHGSHANVQWALRSDPGSVRHHNEDFAGAYAVEEPGSGDRSPAFVVADGLGGHQAGEVASRLAVQRFLSSWSNGSPSPPQQALRNAVREANGAVFDAALEHNQRGMGTTMVALTVAGSEAFVAHVGDSRAYQVRAEVCSQLTADHSRVADMVRMKLLSPEQAGRHPARSQLTRSLGADPAVQVELTKASLKQDDVFILCSDGMWDMVGRADLLEHASMLGTKAAPTPDATAEQLVDLAVKRGAPDNVTCVVVRIATGGSIPGAGPKRGFFRRAGH